MKKRTEDIIIWSVWIIATAVLLLATVGSVQDSNKEFERYQKLNKTDKIIYNCTKDTEWYSGASNGWSKEAQNGCKRITFEENGINYIQDIEGEIIPTE